MLISEKTTRLLAAESDGDLDARRQLLERFYGEIRRLARGQLRRFGSGQREQPTGVANGLIIKLLGSSARLNGRDREHFRAILAHALRNMLVSAHRGDQAAKRGKGIRAVTLKTDAPVYASEVVDVGSLAIETCLNELGRVAPRQLAVLEHRALAGLTALETAGALGLSVSTVNIELHRARLWLTNCLKSA